MDKIKHDTKAFREESVYKVGRQTADKTAPSLIFFIASFSVDPQSQQTITGQANLPVEWRSSKDKKQQLRDTQSSWEVI